MNHKLTYRVISLIIVTAILTNSLCIYTAYINHYATIIANQPITITANPKVELTVEERIVQQADGRYTQLLLNLASCESSLVEFQVGINNDGTYDRGVFQWNSYQPPFEIEDECAFNVECATEQTIKAIDLGMLHHWVCASKI